MGGREHGLGAVEQLLGVLNGEKLEKALGRDAGPAREKPVQMALAQTDVRRQLREFRLALAMPGQIANGRLDSVVVGRVHARLRRSSMGTSSNLNTPNA